MVVAIPIAANPPPTTSKIWNTTVPCNALTTPAITGAPQYNAIKVNGAKSKNETIVG